VNGWGTVRFNEQRRAWTIDYVDATGRRIRQTIGPGENGKRLARKVLAQREAEVRVGLHRLPASQTPRFEQFTRDWLQRSLIRLRPKTAELYVEVYLSSRLQARRRVKARDDRKYDFRYSVLVSVLGRLLAEGWLRETDIAQLKPEKIAQIKRSASAWKMNGA
jgi:hypothetical protein